MLILSCKSRRVAIIGGGFVGQNEAVLFALAGYSVTIVDVNPTVVNAINSGITMIRERDVVEKWTLIKHNISATTSYDAINDANVVVISVNTPLKLWGEDLVKTLENRVADLNAFIDFNPLKQSIKEVINRVKPGTLIALVSTIYPGGTYEHLISSLEKAGISVGRDVYVAYVPERVDPGNNEYTVMKIPRVIGTIDKLSLEKSEEVYGKTFGLKIHPTNLHTAELCKIYENSYRLVNIAFAQEALMKTNTNFVELIKAIKTKPFGIQVFYPGPYAGGTCLVKDALMYYAVTKSEIVRKALITNELTPKFYAEKIYKKLKMKSAKRIIIIGLGFKPGVPYYINDSLNPVSRVAIELRRLDPSLTVDLYDPEIPQYSTVLDPRLEDYDVVLKWIYEELLNFIA